MFTVAGTGTISLISFTDLVDLSKQLPYLDEEDSYRFIDCYVRKLYNNDYQYNRTTVFRRISDVLRSYSISVSNELQFKIDHVNVTVFVNDLSNKCDWHDNVNQRRHIIELSDEYTVLCDIPSRGEWKTTFKNCIDECWKLKDGNRLGCAVELTDKLRDIIVSLKPFNSHKFNTAEKFTLVKSPISHNKIEVNPYDNSSLQFIKSLLTNDPDKMDELLWYAMGKLNIEYSSLGQMTFKQLNDLIRVEHNSTLQRNNHYINMQ